MFFEFGKPLISAWAACIGVANQPNVTASLRLLFYEIADMTKEATDRRPHDMKDAERIGRLGHCDLEKPLGDFNRVTRQEGRVRIYGCPNGLTIDATDQHCAPFISAFGHTASNRNRFAEGHA